MVDLVHLKTFLEVLHRGSFAEAARHLGYTPSAVSQQMALLESGLGVTLFERAARGTLPTAACAPLAERAAEVLGGVTTLEREMQALAGGLAGQIRLGCFPSAAARILPSALVALRESYPGVEISMTEGEPDELNPALLSGELDAVIAYWYRLAPRRWPEGLVADELMAEQSLALVSTQHPLASKRSVRLAVLRDDDWISIRQDSDGDRSLMGLCAAAGFEPKISYRCNDYGVIRELVKANLGVSLVPSLGFEPHPHLRALVTGNRSWQRQVVLLRRTATASPMLQQMLECLRDAALVFDQVRRADPSRQHGASQRGD